jgi:hypothetical protein
MKCCRLNLEREFTFYLTEEEKRLEICIRVLVIIRGGS